MKSDFLFVLENAGWPALLVDGGGTVMRANESAIKLFGPALEGTSPSLSAILFSENGSATRQFLAQWERSPEPVVQQRFRLRGGATAGFAVSVCAFKLENEKLFLLQLRSEALTETKNQNGEISLLAQKQKLDCALQLARTVSLDFNNALTSILGHTSLLLSKAESSHPWRTSLLEVEKSAAKAAEIASDLAAFSRTDKEPRAQIAGNLNSILQRSVELFQTSQDGEIEWSVQLERRLFGVKFDEAKIQQAFVKVLENAVQSLETNGRITVTSRNIDLADPTQDRNVRLEPGAYVCIEITDNGRGIEPDVLPRVFEPFFTTKRGHRGLGLAWVYGIVTNHGGGVAISSKPTAGTSVRLYLSAEKLVVKETSIKADDLTGNETILMVDDEDLLLTMGQTVLSAYGYRVLTASNGQDAIKIFSKEDPAVDLVLTDLVMPGMSGRELVEHIRQLSPETRIIYTTGYVWPAGHEDEIGYLKKPFTSQELLLKVKRSLTTETALVD